jgi:hypothetical protein
VLLLQQPLQLQRLLLLSSVRSFSSTLAKRSSATANASSAVHRSRRSSCSRCSAVVCHCLLSVSEESTFLSRSCTLHSSSSMVFLSVRVVFALMAERGQSVSQSVKHTHTHTHTHTPCHTHTHTHKHTPCHTHTHKHTQSRKKHACSLPKEPGMHTTHTEWPTDRRCTCRFLLGRTHGCDDRIARDRALPPNVRQSTHARCSPNAVTARRVRATVGDLLAIARGWSGAACARASATTDRMPKIEQTLSSGCVRVISLRCVLVFLSPYAPLEVAPVTRVASRRRWWWLVHEGAVIVARESEFKIDRAKM